VLHQHDNILIKTAPLGTGIELSRFCETGKAAKRARRPGR
jgi:hypothetical protein